MSKPKPCPFCGAGLFHHHRPTKHYSWYCGTYRYGNERPVQGDACRVAQLEAENARLKAAWDDARDSILHERGPLAETNAGSDIINAVLDILDDARAAAQAAQAGKDAK